MRKHIDAKNQHRCLEDRHYLDKQLFAGRVASSHYLCILHMLPGPLISENTSALRSAYQMIAVSLFQHHHHPLLLDPYRILPTSRPSLSPILLSDVQPYHDSLASIVPHEHPLPPLSDSHYPVQSSAATRQRVSCGITAATAAAAVCRLSRLHATPAEGPTPGTERPFLSPAAASAGCRRPRAVSISRAAKHLVYAASAVRWYGPICSGGSDSGGPGPVEAAAGRWSGPATQGQRSRSAPLDGPLWALLSGNMPRSDRTTTDLPAVSSI